MRLLLSWCVVVVCCSVVTASPVQEDNVLRFISHDEMVRMEQKAQEKHSDGYQGDQPMEKIKQASVSDSGVQSVPCPDGQSECPDGTTCCKLSTGRMGCCPLPQAVCCPDGNHCCPHGSSCDAATGTCQQGRYSVPWAQKLPAQPRVQAVICPDKKSQCPDGQTCCKLTSGEYGCCPLPKAVCCSDHLHCCPSGYKCDTAKGACDKGDYSLPWVEKQPAQSRLQEVICPGGTSKCPDDNTCCKLASGSYGCCPLPQAVCCSDYVHCCPFGTVCDRSAGACHRGDYSVPWVEKQLAQTRVQTVICPDGKSQCPDGNTCCKLASGSYGCCPLLQAVCCNDHVHCCPHGTTCDVSAGTCSGGDYPVPWVEKQSSQSSVKGVMCPDHESECPDGQTCCMLASGEYGCCPLPDAVCCPDKIHCCPNGYTCSEEQCTKGDLTVPWMEKMPAQPRVQSVVCPDGQSECPDGNTCCKLSTGGYGCCPLPKAVCCSDGVHCCPNGYSCSEGMCTKGDLTVPWMEKMPAQRRVKQVICPDGRSQCPDGSTCCKLSSGGYGCCPLPQAVCCSDGVHCCPNGYTCSEGMCTKGDLTVPWMEKMPAQRRVQDVVCPGGQYKCPDGNTCCMLASGQYGCCPLPKAVCCSDHIHCCPNGYTCNSGNCTKGDLTVPWMEKMPAQPRVKSVVCPDGTSQCPDGNTCCKLSSGGYGCCPLPQAVCCSDGVHCCPNGYTCSEGMCTKGDLTVPWLEKMPAQRRIQNVVCPGSQSECPDGSTCCELASGQYGCCPLPEAVCCSDHIHCCPNGYTCNSGVCTKGDLTVPWMEKLPAQPRVKSVVCPDGTSQCPDGNTCCKLPSGAYGCCPLPQAVCCSDGVHCCPNGYTCGAESCTKGDLTVPWMKKLPAQRSLP